jgi:cytoskeleton protein RodZ
MSALGDTFRNARESQGLTLSDVAGRIHIRSVYLAAIEAEDWSAIGPPVYIRGFLRTYARCLGLDPDAAVASFGTDPRGGLSGPAVVHRKPTRAEPSPSERPEVRKPGFSLPALAGIVIAFALVIFVGYQYLNFAREQSVPVSAERPAVRPESAVQPGRPPTGSRAPAAAPAAELRSEVKGVERSSGFVVRLRDSSWVRVTVDGKVAMEGSYPKGTERSFGGRSATVRVGNAGGVDISVGGKDLGPMGGLGDVAERSFQL